MNHTSRRLRTRITAIISLLLLTLVVVFHAAYAQPPNSSAATSAATPGTVVPAGRPSLATPIAMAGQGAHDDTENAQHITDIAPIVGERNLSAGPHPVQPSSTTAISMTMIDLTPAGVWSVSSINERGEVAGTMSSPRHAFLWQNGAMTDLGALDGGTSGASAINNRGQVVGRFTFDIPSFPYFQSRAFLWQNGAMTDLGALGGDESTAYDINDLGQAVGGAHTPVSSGGSVLHAFLWQNGAMTDLGTLGGHDASSYATGINNLGQVVGISEKTAGIGGPFLWQSGIMTDLIGLGNQFYPTDINDLGQVVGRATVGVKHSYLWQGGSVFDLFTLGGDATEALAINNLGQVVGRSQTFAGTWHAFLWQDGTMTDLGALLGDTTDSTAKDINDAGQIIGTLGGREVLLCSSNAADPLEIRSVTLEHQDVSTGNWISLPIFGGMNTTVDGNFVRITVAVENQGNVDLSAQVQLLDANTGNPLWSGSTFSNQLFPAHQTTNVSYIWDTSGFAWNEDGSAALTRSVKVALWTSICKESRNKIVSVAVDPKPVILVHGIWSNASTWQQYTSFLSSIHPLWSAYAINTMNTGGGFTVGTINTYAQNANELSHFIEKKRQELHAWHVDIVAHSMGGLISRYYIDRLMPQARSDGRPIVSHLIMLGTPNLGSTCAFLPILSTVQLRPDYMLYFNSTVYHHRGVPFSVLAGNPWPATCPFGIIFPYLTGPGDTVVSVNSAIYDVPDNSARTSTVHTDMTTSQKDFLSFVLPRLRLPPSKSHAFSTVGISPQPGAVQEGVHKTALQNDTSSPQFLVSKVVAIPPGASVDVPITVSEVITFGVTLAAPSSITSKLYDPSGSLVVSTLAGSAAANEPFRSFATASPGVGSWNLRLINQGSASMAIPVSAWVGGGATLLNLASMQPDRYGRVQITTTFTRNGKPIANATVIASIAGMDNSTYLATLYDDGLHGDGQAGDGVYSTLSVPLHATVYLVTISATGVDVTRLTSSAFEIPDGVVSLKSMYMPFIRR